MNRILKKIDLYNFLDYQEKRFVEYKDSISVGRSL